MDVSELLYVGPATTAKLNRYAIRTIGDLANANPNFLFRQLGKNGVAIWLFACGADQSRVMPSDYEVPIKTIGHGVACTADLFNEDEVWRVMLELSQDIGHKLRVHKLAATGVRITVKSNELYYRQHQAPLPYATQSPMEIAQEARSIFIKNYNWEVPVRAVTVCAINLIPQETPMQTSIFLDTEKIMRRERLETAIEDIRCRFGKKAIYSAAYMGDLKMPRHGVQEVILPSIVYQ